MPADMPEFIEDLPDVLALAKKRNMTRREQAKLHALDEDQSDVQRSEDDDGVHNVLHSNVKFASLKEQAIFYGDIPDLDPIDYCDRIIAPRQLQIAHAIGCRSRELSPKNLVFGTVLRAVFSASTMGFCAICSMRLSNELRVFSSQLHLGFCPAV
jgi:hypothetical protein